MTTATMNRAELKNNELEMVNGGFKLGDKYEEEVYAAYGVKHESNWWSKDKYTLPDGTVTDYDGVAKYMEQCNAPTKKSKTPNSSHPGPFIF